MHRIPLTSISMAEATLRVEQEHKAPQWEDQRQREFEEALPILTVATKFCIYGAISRFLHLSYVEWRRGRREREKERDWESEGSGQTKASLVHLRTSLRNRSVWVVVWPITPNYAETASHHLWIAWTSDLDDQKFLLQFCLLCGECSTANAKAILEKQTVAAWLQVSVINSLFGSKIKISGLKSQPFAIMENFKPWNWKPSFQDITISHVNHLLVSYHLWRKVPTIFRKGPKSRASFMIEVKKINVLIMKNSTKSNLFDLIQFRRWIIWELI